MARHVRVRRATDPEHGLRPEDRPIGDHIRRGVVLLDKPAGPTSRRAAERVAALLGAEKVGHGGTLDPKVTGVLPVLLDDSTRTERLLLGADKAYAGTMALHGDPADAELEEAMACFRGVIEQTPPRRSRVRRRPRERRVDLFRITERRGRRADFEVHCQGGTYVRKLIHDLGERLGCGAHMSGLRRTRSGPFGLDECAPLQEIERAAAATAAGEPEAVRRLVLTVEDVVGRLAPRLWVDDGAVNSLCTGYPLAAPGVCELEDFAAGDRVALMTLKGELIALAVARMGSAEALGAEEGIVAEPHGVLMEPGTYPSWRPREEA